MKILLLVALALLLLAGPLTAQDNKASVLLSSAIYEEEVSGNLDKAIELYLDILKKYPDDRPAAAKALYHLGLVNEKMGKRKAGEYFTQWVNIYPDQQEIVTLAKEMLYAGHLMTISMA
ncbi:MAG: tetratricopeptide repeat protein, partial [Bacteroidia bacterium]|nr:tetratricopeptide repeat protein [Bacteroidia bacterium]